MILTLQEHYLFKKKKNKNKKTSSPNMNTAEKKSLKQTKIQNQGHTFTDLTWLCSVGLAQLLSSPFSPSVWLGALLWRSQIGSAIFFPQGESWHEDSGALCYSLQVCAGKLTLQMTWVKKKTLLPLLHTYLFLGLILWPFWTLWIQVPAWNMSWVCPVAASEPGILLPGEWSPLTESTGR